MDSLPASLLLLFLACMQIKVALSSDVSTSGLPHVNDCNYCFECLTVAPSPNNLAAATSAAGSSQRHRRALQQALSLPKGATRKILNSPNLTSGILDDAWANEPDAACEAAAAASGIPGTLTNPHQVQPHIIAPSDHDAKQLKPNCTRCVGCTTVLTDMHAGPVEAEGMDGLAFMHGKGATNGWLFFGNVPGATKRYIVKVYCMPYSKAHGRPQTCATGVYTERMRLMMAQVRLTDECGAEGITPRVWVAPVNAIIPNGTFKGYHVRWYGLWMEEAPGITLHGLWVTRGAENTMFDLLTRKINQTQVVQQTVLDLLTAQCDRHSENVFITESGRLSFIDNDRALGVVTRCGSDSMLLPGNRYHTQLRLGYWGHIMNYYQKHANRPGFCNGPVDMRVIIDYRCFVPGGRIDHKYPLGLRTCMKALARHRVPDIMQRYGFTQRKPAEILKRRSRDMLTLGFEGALKDSPPRSAARYVYKPQPPCCGIVMDLNGGAKCASCWKPVMDEFKDALRDTMAHAKEVLVGPEE